MMRKKRRQLGLTQQQLADKLKVKQAFVSELERGTKKPSIERLESIARALKCKAAELLDESGKESPIQCQPEPQKAETVFRDYGTPAGLRAFADDHALINALAVTPGEWAVLRAVQIEGISKDGYLQLLVTFRSVTRTCHGRVSEGSGRGQVSHGSAGRHR